MSWRWLERVLPPAFGVVLESLWLGALAALLTSVGPGPAIAGALVLTGIGAWLGTAPAGAGARQLRLRRAAGVAVLVVVVGTLMVAEMPSGGRAIAGALVRDVIGVGAALLLGSRLGGGERDPRGAARHAVRCCVLLAGVLAGAAAAGEPQPGGVLLVLTAALVAVLSVATARVDYELGAGAAGGRPARGPLAALAVVLVTVLAVAAASGAVGGPVRSLLGWIGDGLRVVVGGIGYALGWLAGQLVRLVQGLAELLRGETAEDPLQGASPAPVATPAGRSPTPGSDVIAEVVGWTMAAAVTAAVLLIVWRRLAARRREHPDRAQDEHEALVPVRDVPRRVASRLAALFERTERALTSRDPVEALRREYRHLERRLTAAGYPRDPASTVRSYLAGLPLDEAAMAAAPSVAGLYEQARYSRAGCGWTDVSDMRALCERVRAAVQSSGQTDGGRSPTDPSGSPTDPSGSPTDPGGGPTDGSDGAGSP